MNVAANTVVFGAERDFVRVHADLAPTVEAKLSSLGRTEDIRFSPDNTRLAVARFHDNAICIFDIALAGPHGTYAPRISGCRELRSSGLCNPHGFDFIGNDHLVVTNRGGRIAVFDIRPADTVEEAVFHRDPVRTIKRSAPFRNVCSPGSVCVTRFSRGHAEILVCNNYADLVTRHRFPVGRRFGLSSNAVALRRGLDLPDGIAVTPDGKRVAISNHNTSTVVIYDRQAGLRPGSEPVGRLLGIAYPHGLRFLAGGTQLCVADAGAPHVRVYASKDGRWLGDHRPVCSVRVMDDETFLRGHANVAEGGPKGLDVDAGGGLLVVSCEELPLAFFAIPPILHADDRLSASI